MHAFMSLWLAFFVNTWFCSMAKTGTYVVSGSGQNAQSCAQKCGNFVWNSEKGACCGRTPSSWAKLLAFYLVYYIFLAGFFAGSMAILFTFVAEDYPNYYLGKAGMSQHIVYQPGMDFVPNMPCDSDGYVMSADSVTTPASIPNLRFDKTDATTYQVFLDKINSYVQAYNSSSGTYTVPSTCGVNDVASTCNISLSQLGPCDYTTNPSMGYDQGEPCVLLKMNRIINWKPSLYTSAPNMTQPYTDFDANNTALSCMEMNAKGGIIAPTNFNDILTKFYPNTGFSSSCYPYCGKIDSPDYLSPLVALKVAGITPNKQVFIYCRVWLEGFESSKMDRIGSFKFSVHLD